MGEQQRRHERLTRAARHVEGRVTVPVRHVNRRALLKQRAHTRAEPARRGHVDRRPPVHVARRVEVARFVNERERALGPRMFERDDQRRAPRVIEIVRARATL